VDAARRIAKTPNRDASIGRRKKPRIKLSIQQGFAYQANTPAKMPDQPTTSARKPNMMSFGFSLFRNSSAGRQQAAVNKTKLMLSRIVIFKGG
jgi:hypothetical protein